MSAEKLERLVDAIYVSGLWASYGDAAKAADYGSAARAVANINWKFSRSRLGRADGTTQSEDSEKNKDWIADHPTHMRVGEAFGYVEGVPRPQRLRLTVPELLMLLGEMPSSPALRAKVHDQLDVLLAETDRAQARGDERVDELWHAVEESRALLARLY